MTVTKYSVKENLAKVAKNLGFVEDILLLKGDIIKERHDTDLVSSMSDIMSHLPLHEHRSGTIAKTSIEVIAISRPSVTSPRKHGLIPGQHRPPYLALATASGTAKMERPTPDPKNSLSVDLTKERTLPSVFGPITLHLTLTDAHAIVLIQTPRSQGCVYVT